MRALSTPLVALALAAIASSASAAPKVAVSSLPSIALTPAKNPKRVASVAGVVVGKAPAYKGATYVNVDAAVSQGYCFVSRDYTLRLSKTISDGDVKELWHLSEADGTATLERTFLEIDKETHEVLVAGRTSGTLREIATQPDGVVVWGFRDGGDAVVVVKRAHVGVESTRPPRDDETPMVPAFSSECAFGAARIDVRAPEKGATAQLVGGLPPKGTGKEQVFPRFMVDVSVSRVARDPEPVLAARIRVRD